MVGETKTLKIKKIKSLKKATKKSKEEKQPNWKMMPFNHLEFIHKTSFTSCFIEQFLCFFVK